MRNQYNEARPFAPAQPNFVAPQPTQQTRSTFSSDTPVTLIALSFCVSCVMCAALHFWGTWSVGQSVIASAVMFLAISTIIIVLYSGLIHTIIQENTRRQEIDAQYPAAEHDEMHTQWLNEIDDRLSTVEARVMQKSLFVGEKGKMRKIDRWSKVDQELQEWLRTKFFVDGRPKVTKSGQIHVAFTSALSREAVSKLQSRRMVDRKGNNWFWTGPHSPAEVKGLLWPNLPPRGG